MDNPAPRAARLQAIRGKWFVQPMQVQFPPLTSRPEPTTCDEFVRSYRVASAFSSLHETPEEAGLSEGAAEAEDRRINAERFGVEDPKILMQELSQQFDRAPTGQVDPEALKKGFVVLDSVKEGAMESAAHEGTTQPGSVVDQSQRADVQALDQALAVVQELANELGISLPLSRRSKHLG
jgi:hypothetical protein